MLRILEEQGGRVPVSHRPSGAEDNSCCSTLCDEDQISVNDGDMLVFKHHRRRYYLVYLCIICALLLTVYCDKSTPKASLECIKHPRESNSTYHAHEDVDCTLHRDSDVFNFEFADVLIRPRRLHEPLASQGSSKRLFKRRMNYGVFLLGSPRRKNELYLFRWYNAIEEAVRDARKVSTFLNKTKHEAGLIRLRMAYDERPLFDRIYLVEILCLAAFWFLPINLMTTFDAKLDVFVQEQRNVYGIILKRLSFPLERVSFCNVEAFDAVSVRPQAGAMLPVKQKEYSLNVRTFKGEKFDLRMGKLLLTASKAKRKLSMIQSFLNRINGFRESTMVESEDFDEEMFVENNLNQSLRNRKGSDCVVCLSRTSTVALMPCRHVCLCKRCSYDIGECPICRTQVSDRIYLYL